ncbi:hypothetical protein JTE90_008160 [Oedothorax gibbosus]|uniref:Uncharacterized protein n=1 Tax=Oedothorax gibbosus TaxID=931172 RepID=A0AAV6VE60_9ARAC|nr:hypothetical protein JTE90_008160 [Oedothorax gibbosus]
MRKHPLIEFWEKNTCSKFSAGELDGATSLIGPLPPPLPPPPPQFIADYAMCLGCPSFEHTVNHCVGVRLLIANTKRNLIPNYPFTTPFSPLNCIGAWVDPVFWDGGRGHFQSIRGGWKGWKGGARLIHS